MGLRFGCSVLAVAVLVAAAGATPAAAAECDAAIAQYDIAGAPAPGYPDDPLFPRQWNLQQIRVPIAWERGHTGRGATIAVIDSGVDLNHPDLRAQVVAGLDVSEGEPGEPPDCPPGPYDENGHGTRVAGIAAADTDNAEGIAGVAPDARLLPVKFGPGLTPSQRREALGESVRWAADRGADVINLPAITGFARDAFWSAAMDAAVDYAWEKGAVVVSPAGNRQPPFDTEPTCQQPARRAICVAGVDRNGSPALYSNLPVHPNGGVGLRAPGGALEEGPGSCDDQLIWSTSLPTTTPLCSGLDGYDQRGATSWAAPHVTGLAAILAGAGLRNDEIVDCLKRTSSGGGSTDPLMGYGIPDADAATSTCLRPAARPDPRLRISVAPRRVRRGEGTRFRFRVTAGVRGRRRPVEGAEVRLRGRRSSTGRRGRATLVARLPAARRYTAHACRTGFRCGRVSIVSR